MPTGDFCGGPHARAEQPEMHCPSQPQQEMPPGPIELPPPVPSHFLPPPIEGPAYGSLNGQVHGPPVPLGMSSISNLNANNTGLKRPGQKPPLRKGKWTPEEEVYAHFIIDNFNKGLINLPRGTTLRSYLSEKLNCDPMRVTKKFSGTSCIGKSVFCPCEPNADNIELMKEVSAKLNELEKEFRNKVEHQGAASHIDGLLRSFGRQWLTPLKMSEFSALDGLKPPLKLETLGRPPRPFLPERFSEDLFRPAMPPAALPHPHPPVQLVRNNSGGAPPAPPAGVVNNPPPAPEANNVRKTRRAEGDDFALTDQDAGDLLVNFFASVHRTYAAGEEEESEGSPSPVPEKEPGECWASYKTHELAAGEPDLVSQALKRQKVIDGC